MSNVFGLDIGGSGIKGAPVDLARGELVGERVRLVTPAGAKVEEIAKTAAEVVASFGYAGLAGAAFPAVIVDGHARNASNIDIGWIGTDVAGTLSDATGCDVRVLNDADAAGLAEMRFGAGRDVGGTVALLTLGTGIGSALFLDGQLVPNTELGHLEIDGQDAELKTAESARDREDLSWEQWARRLSKYLRRFEALLWPDLFILGGGVSRKADKFVPLLEGVRTKIVVAELQNGAGIIGAALRAAQARGGAAQARGGAAQARGG
jgi:polyphosphate glucokinase